MMLYPFSVPFFQYLFEGNNFSRLFDFQFQRSELTYLYSIFYLSLACYSQNSFLNCPALINLHTANAIFFSKRLEWNFKTCCSLRYFVWYYYHLVVKRLFEFDFGSSESMYMTNLCYTLALEWSNFSCLDSGKVEVDESSFD